MTSVDQYYQEYNQLKIKFDLYVVQEKQYLPPPEICRAIDYNRQDKDLINNHYRNKQYNFRRERQ